MRRQDIEFLLRRQYGFTPDMVSHFFFIGWHHQVEGAYDLMLLADRFKRRASPFVPRLRDEYSPSIPLFLQTNINKQNDQLLLLLEDV